MHSLVVFIVAYGFVSVKADLTCLGWGLISPIVGLFCYFEPEYFQEAENKTVAAVEDAIQSTEDLVHFDLTHNPAVVAYDFYEETSNGGLEQGGKYLQNVSKDFGDVTIGFAKDTANQLVTIMEFSYWNDVSMCLITGAGGLITQSKRRGLGKRAIIPSVDSAVSMAQKCTSQKFKELASPATFNITGKNQKIGSTISNIAGLLVPIGAEGAAGVKTAESLEGAVDLAIPGSESTTRVVKKVGENTGDHFANEAEANAVAEKMKDEKWLDENCGICGVSPPPLGDMISKRKRHSTDQLDRRGVIATSCCPASSTDANQVAEGSVAAESAEVGESEVRKGLIHNPAEYMTVMEDNLRPPPKFIERDINYPEDVKDLSGDLDAYSTGVVSWSPRITDIMTSDQVFSFLRRVFEGSTEDSLYQALNIKSRDNGLRMYSASHKWMKVNNPALQRLSSFVSASIEHGCDVVTKLKNLSPARAIELEGEVEFFYTAPNLQSLTGTDPRGFHIDGGMMQFGIADVPGLCVMSTRTGLASRMPVQKNAFQLLKARFWDIQAWYRQSPQGPTWHSVFGPQMAQEGRVSMIMTIYQRKLKDW